MAVYEYEAIAASGKSVKGVIDADTAAGARRKLREQKLYPTTVTETFEKESGGASREISFGGGRVKLRDITVFTRSMAVLLQAGMPLVEALNATLQQTPNPRLNKTIYDIRDHVNSGSTLGDALAKHPRIFNNLYVNMVRAGESSGGLEQVLFRLADVLERQLKLKHRVLSMLVYPACMAGFGLLLIVFLMIFIVPRIVQIFERQEEALPFITVLLIGITDFLVVYWWVIAVGILGGIAIWRAWVARPAGRYQWDTFKLWLPGFGKLYSKMICARFSRTLGTMLESGLTMMSALDIVKSVLQNRVFEEAMEEVKTGVRRGRDLAQPLRDANLFPPMLVHMTELGQRSGEIEGMLIKVSDTYEEDVELTVDALVSVLEPVIIIMMGLFVGFMVLAILLPILDMSGSVG